MHHHQMHITVQNKQKWIWAKAAKAERNIPIRNLMRLYRHSHVPRVLSITTKIFLHENCAYFNTWKLLRGEIECCWQLLYVQLNIVYCINVSVCVCVAYVGNCTFCRGLKNILQTFEIFYLSHLFCIFHLYRLNAVSYMPLLLFPLKLLLFIFIWFNNFFVFHSSIFAIENFATNCRM